jgi:tRNA-dihydrouridine synthase
MRDKLKEGIFLSSMMKRTDGEFCAREGVGADMVQLGALIADREERNHPPESLLPVQPRQMAAFLREWVDPVRNALGDIPIFLNGAPGDIKSAVDMAGAFQDAGGDGFELNVHGGYKPHLERGLLRALALPENRERLFRFTEALVETEVPLIVKFHITMADRVNFPQLCREIHQKFAPLGIHFNVRGKDGSPDLDFTRTIREAYDGMLFCSGYVKTRDDVDTLLTAGADCVGIAQGVLDSPGLIGRLA